MDYKELDVWKKSRSLTSSIYNLSRTFPKDEVFGLTSQMRRAAVSVSSNIAEGCGRQHAKDSIQIFYIARGSLYELETQLYVASDQGYVKQPVFDQTINEITNCKQMLNGLIKYFKGL
ncbi:four helix bundle protein [Pontibacter sp. 172403-2]|nr:four helix bundle protein [Pontibacter sp. 172403-2]